MDENTKEATTQPPPHIPLTDEQWEKIKNLFPGSVPSRTTLTQDNRLFIDAVSWIIQTGASWRSLPPQYGKWSSVHKRFTTWTQLGIWKRIQKILSGQKGDAGNDSLEWLKNITSEAYKSRQDQPVKAEIPHNELGTMSDPDLARKYSVSHTTIIKLRRKHGIKSYQKPKAHIDWQHWDAFVADETMTAEGLATLMGVDISTVRKRRRLLQAGNLG